MKYKTCSQYLTNCSDFEVAKDLRPEKYLEYYKKEFGKIDENYITQLEKSCGSKNVQIIPIENNGEYSLSEVYNKILEQSENDIVVRFDATQLTNESFKYIQQLAEIFEANEIEEGDFEFDIFRVTVNSVKAYHKQLIRYE